MRRTFEIDLNIDPAVSVINLREMLLVTNSFKLIAFRERNKPQIWHCPNCGCDNELADNSCCGEGCNVQRTEV